MCNPLNSVPFYIGKSTDGINRPMEHIKLNSHNNDVNDFINTLKQQSISPVILILESVDSESMLNNKEAFWIKKYTDMGYVLLNKTHIHQTEILVKDVENKDLIRSFIKQNRLLLNMSQQDLAEKSNLNRSTIAILESNGEENIGVSTLTKVLNVFGATLSISKKPD